MSRRRNSPIASGPHVSGSSMVNMLARRNAQSKLKSPSSNAISPIHGHHTPASLHDLSPAPPRGDSPDSFHDRLAPTPTHGSKRRPRKLTSIILKEAEPIYTGGFLMQGRCNYCNTIFPASKVSGTSQLARHLRLCEVKSAMDGVVKQIRTSEEIDPDWRFDQESARIHLVNLVVLHGLPFSFVEYSGFRKFCTALNPWFKSISRVTVQNDCIEAYKQFKSNYQLDFKNFDHRVSLTLDLMHIHISQK